MNKKESQTRIIRIMFKIVINLLIGVGSIIIYVTNGFWGFIFGVFWITLGDITIEYIPRRTSKHRRKNE